MVALDLVEPMANKFAAIETHLVKDMSQPAIWVPPQFEKLPILQTQNKTKIAAADEDLEPGHGPS
ncbi:MAG: hypothetical protein ACK587_06095 [Cyanobacteriota bacterium]